MAQSVIAFSDRLQEVFSAESVRELEGWFHRANPNEAQLTTWRDELAEKLRAYEAYYFDDGAPDLTLLEMYESRCRLLAWGVIGELILDKRPELTDEEVKAQVGDTIARMNTKE